MTKLLPIGVLLTLTAAWWWAASGSAIFPTPPEVLQGMVQLAEDGTLLRHVSASLYRVTFGYGAAVLLAVRQELIDQQRETVQRLVDNVLAAGHWLDTSPEHRTKAARIASGQSMFNQVFEVIKWVMERPPDRVTYGDLRLMRAEFDELMRLSLDAKILDRPIDYHTYVDESFMKNAHPVEIHLPAQ